MNLSLSPNGKWLVFDMLGDLYLLSTKGGTARQLTSGPRYDRQPKWSPDGRSIMFTSDRSGNNNTWVLRFQDKQYKTFFLQRLSYHKYIETNDAIWRPDGMFFVHRRRITDRRSVGVVELWMHSLIGGKGFQLTSSKRIADANDPAFSPDGRYVYFAARGRHRYNRNVHSGIWRVMRLDTQTKRFLLVTRNASRPTPSPDGKWLAVLRRIGRKTAIVLHNLASGREHTLLDHLDRDDQEGFAADGTYPACAWTPDSQHLIYTAKGQFWKTNIQTKRRTNIPFVATIKQRIRRALYVKRQIGQRHFRAKMLRWTRLSPNRKHIAFVAVGRIWLGSWPKMNDLRALPHPKGNVLTYAPSFSADSKRLAYVTWNDKTRGHVWIRSVLHQKQLPQRVTSVPGYYANPDFSQDGTQLTFVRASGAEARGLDSSWQPWQEILRVSLKQTLPTKQTTHIARLRNHGPISHMPQPHFSPDGTRIFFTRVKNKGYKRYTTLCSRRIDGLDEQQFVSIYAGEDLRVSNNGRWLLFRHLHHIYLSLLPPPQKRAIGLRINDGRYGGSPLPILHLTATDDGGNWPGWSGDTMVWSLGHDVYTLSLKQAIQRLQANQRKKGTPKSKAKKQVKSKDKKKKAKISKRLPWTKRSIKLMVPSKQPKGLVALTGLKIISMKGKQIIQNGTIILDRNRIKQVGTKEGVTIPKGTKIIHLPGKVAIPGMIDVHAHLHYGALDIHPQQSWSYRANLVYGVTTVHDPSASTELVLAQGERVKAGQMTGPRVFSTGFILYGAENTHKAVIRSRQDAVHHLRRLKRQGAWSVKSYMQPSRKQRRWVMEAARQEKMLVYPEGGGRLFMNLTMILDGHTGIEHALPTATLYPDVIRLFAASQTGYTPTFLVAYGGVAGEVFFYQFHNPWNDAKLRRFVPARYLRRKARRRSTTIYDQDWHYQQVAKGAHQIVKAGGRVQIGSHGQLQGLGYHWEMKALSQGGMPPHDVLRAATLHGAVYLGLDRDLGSIEVGKLADIAILDRDPMIGIKHSHSVHLVVKNGVIYDGHTLKIIHQ